ncbi:hypothetical protein JD79_04111 [Geodermatophilus normandii]|uniref:Uncharacterized protein n=2 Tax=Geodermatophilus normandii TaxID=1137989 RepID=A0A317QP88_9ACTN|nr:hypothetical protein JD79_04111 [Geodermatophilus normandii]
MMREWLDRELKYIGPDLALAARVPDLIKANPALVEVLMRAAMEQEEGEQGPPYSYKQMKALMKAEWQAKPKLGLKSRYRERACNADSAKRNSALTYDIDGVAEAIGDRISYLMARGVTTNNRHVPWKYVIDNCVELDLRNPAASLRAAVGAGLAETRTERRVVPKRRRSAGTVAS